MNKTKIIDGNQTPKKFTKQTKTSRTTVLALNGPILRENEANMVRNTVLKYIPWEMSFTEVIFKLNQHIM